MIQIMFATRNVLYNFCCWISGCIQSGRKQYIWSVFSGRLNSRLAATAGKIENNSEIFVTNMLIGMHCWRQTSHTHYHGQNCGHTHSNCWKSDADAYTLLFGKELKYHTQVSCYYQCDRQIECKAPMMNHIQIYQESNSKWPSGLWSVEAHCVRYGGQLYEVFLWLPEQEILPARVGCFEDLCVSNPLQCGNQSEGKVALMKHIVEKQFLCLVFKVFPLADWPLVIAFNGWKPNLASFHLLLSLV